MNEGLDLFRPECLARNIRRFRMQRGLTRVQLARELYVTAQNVYKWETGKTSPSAANLYMLSRALQISADQLLNCSETAQ